MLVNREIQAMTQSASLLLASLKTDPCDYSGTELYATGEYFANAQKGARGRGRGSGRTRWGVLKMILVHEKIAVVKGRNDLRFCRIMILYR